MFKFYTENKVKVLTRLESLMASGALDYCFPVLTNCYGENDYFGREKSNFIPKMIRLLYDAKNKNHSEVYFLSGQNTSIDFINADDVAHALFLLAQKHCSGIYNVATGTNNSLIKTAQYISDSLNSEVTLSTNWQSVSSGNIRKIETKRIRSLGWAPKITLKEGIQKTVDWFVLNAQTCRGSRESNHQFIKKNGARFENYLSI